MSDYPRKKNRLGFHSKKHFFYVGPTRYALQVKSSPIHQPHQRQSTCEDISPKGECQRCTEATPAAGLLCSSTSGVFGVRCTRPLTSNSNESSWFPSPYLVHTIHVVVLHESLWCCIVVHAETSENDTEATTCCLAFEGRQQARRSASMSAPVGCVRLLRRPEHGGSVLDDRWC